jgi:hypothetical protein
MKDEMKKVKKECLDKELYRKNHQKTTQSFKKKRMKDELNTKQRKQTVREDNQKTFEFRQQS